MDVFEDDDSHIDFLDEEETYLDQLYFDLDFNPKFSSYKEETVESIIDVYNILNEICENM